MKNKSNMRYYNFLLSDRGLERLHKKFIRDIYYEDIKVRTDEEVERHFLDMGYNYARFFKKIIDETINIPVGKLYFLDTMRYLYNKLIIFLERKNALDIESILFAYGKTIIYQIYDFKQLRSRNNQDSKSRKA